MDVPFPTMKNLEDGKEETEPKCNNKDYLAAFGLRRERWALLDDRLWIAVAVLALCGLVLVVRSELLTSDQAQAAAGFLAIIAASLGFWQWHQVRQEISMDKYYERLDLANRRRENGDRSVYQMMRYKSSERDEDDLARMMYVYAELDNLEYAIGKYELGFMKPTQACRALRTFQIRCLCPGFRKRALPRVRRGDYYESTRNVVERVCAVAVKLEELRGAPRRLVTEATTATAPTSVLPELIGLIIVLAARRRPAPAPFRLSPAAASRR